MYISVIVSQHLYTKYCHMCTYLCLFNNTNMSKILAHMHVFVSVS